MRHVLANIITYAVALLLFVGAALFARMRASQYTLTYHTAVLAAYEPARDTAFSWQRLGADTYTRNCRNCHAEDGMGWDQYPPVAAAAARLAQPRGREWLIDVMLRGVSRPQARVPMPAMPTLHDVEIAAVLNHIIAVHGGVGDFDAFTPDEVRARRAVAPRAMLRE